MPGTYRVSQVPNASLSACHSLWTPPARLRSHLLQSSRVGFRNVNGVANRVLPTCVDNFDLGAVPAFRDCDLPYGLQSSLCTLRLCRSAFTSFINATLGTSGWLNLTRQGLPPCKKRQAALGAHRGRDIRFRMPPTQIPACGTTAPGSSVTLAFAFSKDTSFRACVGGGIR